MAKDSKYGIVNIKGIPNDEPIFVLRAQDVFAVHTIQVYKGLRESSGDILALRKIDNDLERFKEWQRKRNRKIPD